MVNAAFDLDQCRYRPPPVGATLRRFLGSIEPAPQEPLAVGKDRRSPQKRGPTARHSLPLCPPMGEAAGAFVYFLKDENAATDIEYGLIAAGAALAIFITVIQGRRQETQTTFSSISSQLN